MAKRLTDTEKWGKAWFRQLTPVQKSVLQYLQDNCDHAGIWDIDMAAMCFHVNTDVAQEDLRSLGARVRRIGEDKLFVVGFIEFQYKLASPASLNKENSVHRSVIQRLSKLGFDDLYVSIGSPLLAPSKPLDSPCPYPKEKEKEEDKVKDRDQEEEKKKEKEGLTLIDPSKFSDVVGQEILDAQKRLDKKREELGIDPNAPWNEARA